MESTSKRAFLIAVAGLLAVTLGFVAVRHSRAAPPAKVVAADVQAFQAERDARDARTTSFLPPDDARLQEQIGIARARLVELQAEIDEVRVRIAGCHE